MTLRLAFTCLVSSPAAIADRGEATAQTLSLSFGRGIHLLRQEQRFVPLDLLNTALANLGYDLRITVWALERSTDAAQRGVTDGYLFRMAAGEDEKPNLLRVPEPLFTGNLYAFTTDAQARHWGKSRPRALIMLREVIATERGIPPAYRDVPIVWAKDISQALILLARKRGDAILAPKLFADALLHQGAAMPLVQLPEPVNVQPMYIYLHRRHSDLVQPLAEEMRRLKSACDYDNYTPMPCDLLERQPRPEPVAGPGA